MRIGLRGFGAACLLSAMALATAQGATIRYQATGTFTNSGFPADIAPGDSFIIHFAYDDSVQDVNDGILAGSFPGAARQMDFKLQPGASGSYAGGIGSSFFAIQTFDGAGPYPSGVPDRFSINATNGSFPPVGGYGFGGLMLVLDDYTHTTSIHDTGSGQTLGAQLGGTLDLNQFAIRVVRIGANDKAGGYAQGYVATLRVVPEVYLQISVAEPGGLLLTWPTNPAPWFLEGTASLGGEWETVTNAVNTTGGWNTVSVNRDTSFRVFRLRQP